MNRMGVLLVCFDLPTKTKLQKREYAAFRKYLKSNGYICLQESVYVKLFRNISNTYSEKNDLKSVSPKEGSILALNLSYKSFENLTAILGKEFDFHFFAAETIYV